MGQSYSIIGGYHQSLEYIHVNILVIQIFRKSWFEISEVDWGKFSHA